MRCFSAISDLETPALFGRIGKLTEAIGEFDPANIKLEPFGKARIVAAWPRQRRFTARIFVEDRRAADAEFGSTRATRTLLKISDHVSSAQRRCRRAVWRASCRDHRRRRSASRGRSMPACSANASRHVIRSGSANGSRSRPRNENSVRPPVAAAPQIAAQSSMSNS